jgi:hypothetical protein
MLYQKMMIFPVLTFIIVSTACTALRSIDGASPEEIKKSELSKDDLWDRAKTLEKEKTIYQQHLADQAGVVSRMDAGLSDQQNELSQMNARLSAQQNEI